MVYIIRRVREPCHGCMYMCNIVYVCMYIHEYVHTQELHCSACVDTCDMFVRETDRQTMGTTCVPRVYVRMYIYVYACMYDCTTVCMHVCMAVLHAGQPWQTDRETDRQNVGSARVCEPRHNYVYVCMYTVLYYIYPLYACMYDCTTVCMYDHTTCM
jgi:hypothetical protein